MLFKFGDGGLGGGQIAQGAIAFAGQLLDLLPDRVAGQGDGLRPGFWCQHRQGLDPGIGVGGGRSLDPGRTPGPQIFRDGGVAAPAKLVVDAADRGLLAGRPQAVADLGDEGLADRFHQPERMDGVRIGQSSARPPGHCRILARC